MTFYGRGAGTGVGLSQWGARGRALAGQEAAAILAHYYPGPTIGTVAPDQTGRVLVMNGFVPTATRPAHIFGRGGPWTIDGVPMVFPADAMLDLTRLVTPANGVRWLTQVTDQLGQMLYSGAQSNELWIRPASPTSVIQVWFKPSVYDTYRGVVHVTGSSSLRVVNEVPLDVYLAGVVPAEMPYTWPTEALRAQAIAARSYAVRRLHPSWGTFDLYDDTRNQLYFGVKAEEPSGTAAVTDTAGQVLLADGVVANTLYNSVAGGATESNQFAYPAANGRVFVAAVPYLAGSSDRAPDGAAYDAGSSYASWHTATYTVETLSAILDADPRTNVGLLTVIDLSHRGVSGRLYAITLVGTTGVVTVSGDVFRAVFNGNRPSSDPILRSSLFDLAPIP